MPGTAPEKVAPRFKGLLLKEVPCKLHKRMKIQAARQEKTLIEWCLAAFQFYLKNGGKR